MIEVKELTKRYGEALALDRLSFQVHPGRVTGFLGPNGAGKSTTLRIIVGLHAATSGVALVNGRPYAEINRPLHEVGVLLDAGAVHPGRTAYNQLACLARSHRIGRSRIMTLLELVGLRDVAHKRIGGFSLGMRQRLGIAAALLGDPGVVLLDEPVNGLDAEGIRWMRGLMRTLAAEGRTVLLSSHLMSEMALTVDHVLIIGRGRLIAETSMEDLTGRFRRDILVRSPRHVELGKVLRSAGASVTFGSQGSLAVTGADTATIGDLAAERGIPIHELTPRSATLEEVYLDMTDEAADYRAAEYRAGEYRAAADRVGADRVGADRVGGDRVGGDRVGGDRVGGDRVGGDRVGGDRVGGDRVGGDRAGDDRAGDDRAAEYRAATDRVGDDRAGDDRAGDDRAAEYRVGDYRAANDPSADHRSANYRAADYRAGGGEGW